MMPSIIHIEFYVLHLINFHKGHDQEEQFVLVERILILNFCLLEHEHSQDEDQHVQNQYEIFVRQIDELIFRQSMKKLIYGR
jgi:hypothetical protein